MSPEDFSAVTASGEQVFSHLSQVRSDASTAYLPLVQEPVGAVQKLFSDEITNVPAKDFNIDSVKTSAIVVDLDDVQDDEDRTSMLARHGKFDTPNVYVIESINKLHNYLSCDPVREVTLYSSYLDSNSIHCKCTIRFLI